MNVKDYIKPKYVVATHVTYMDWLKKTNKSALEFVHVGSPHELFGLDRKTTQVYFVGNYWRAHAHNAKIQICIEREYKIVHVDNF